MAYRCSHILQKYSYINITCIAFFPKSYSVHYRDKETIGERLAKSGLAIAYGIRVNYQGPMPTALAKTHTTMTILYDNGETAINVRNTWGFEVV